ncbi:hypothetical protein [Arsenicibacter rosenii]|uniref:Uncharacterized protein n=1 Tax=Arsenicibacter rosenii TaxID=1750698 RepID=A0A1S2VBR3_9BACT|nr:hypothetical protein [Arsenicibacter rosenii]OIN55656.1 hypothetical protein BLX24_28895 [Arsenicibacter rosenii]
MTLPNLTGKTFRFRLFNILFIFTFSRHSDGFLSGSFEIGTPEATPAADPEPVAAEPLKLEKPDYDPATGEIEFRTSGGDGSAVEFSAIGVTRWTTETRHVIEAGIRNDPNSGPILIEALQAGKLGSYSFDLHEGRTKTVPASDAVMVSPRPVAVPDKVAAGPVSYPEGQLARPVFSDRIGEYDLKRFGTVGPWPDGFVYCDFMRDMHQPLDDHFLQQQLVMQLGLTGQERADETLRGKIYVEITTSDLGAYQRHREFVLAEVSTVLASLALDGNYKGVDRVSFNFETTYAPAYDSYDAVTEMWPHADVTYLRCESEELKDQSMTLKELWEKDGGNRFRAEIAQRMVNRHVALLTAVKRFCGPDTLVTCGDGSVSYFVGVAQNLDHYEEIKALRGGASFYDYYYSLPANYKDPVYGESISGKTFWQAAQWQNLYVYNKTGQMAMGDWQQAQNEKYGDYLNLWAKTNPSEEWYDASIPAWFEINRRKLGQCGVVIPQALQVHYRYEDGIYPDSQYEKFSKHFGPDEAVCPPWHNYGVGVLARMSATIPRSGLTNWRTVKRWGDPVWDDDINATRPHSESLAYRAAMADMFRYEAFFDPANRPVFLFENYVTYAGDPTFRKRTAKEIARNPATKNSVNALTRLIQIGGEWHVLVVATNWRQREDEETTFSLSFLPEDVPGLKSTRHLENLTIKGRWPFIQAFRLP